MYIIPKKCWRQTQYLYILLAYAIDTYNVLSIINNFIIMFVTSKTEIRLLLLLFYTRECVIAINIFQYAIINHVGVLILRFGECQ